MRFESGAMSRIVPQARSLLRSHPDGSAGDILAAKPDDLNSTLWTHAGRKLTPAGCLLNTTPVLSSVHTPECAHTETQTKPCIFFKFINTVGGRRTPVRGVGNTTSASRDKGSSCL